MAALLILRPVVPMERARLSSTPPDCRLVEDTLLHPVILPLLLPLYVGRLDDQE